MGDYLGAATIGPWNCFHVAAFGFLPEVRDRRRDVLQDKSLPPALTCRGMNDIFGSHRRVSDFVRTAPAVPDGGCQSTIPRGESSTWPKDPFAGFRFFPVMNRGGRPEIAVGQGNVDLSFILSRAIVSYGQR